jgi:hypothetical protein
MSLDSKKESNGTMNPQATAVIPKPLDSRSDTALPLGEQQHDPISPDVSDHAATVSQVSDYVI